MRSVFLASVSALGSVVLLSSVTSAATLNYWRFEEASGQALDSADDHHGTLLGGATRTATVFGSPVPQTGDPNTQSVEFDGVNGSVVNMGSNPQVLGNDFTLEAFFRVDSASQVAAIAGKFISGAFSDKGWVLRTGPVGVGQFTVNFDTRDGASSPGQSVASGNLNEDTWYHAAGVRQGMTMSLYIDGALVGTTPIVDTGDFNSAQSFGVGGDAGNQTRALDGFVDEVRLSNVALSPSQFLNAVPEPSMTAMLLGVLPLCRRRPAR